MLRGKTGTADAELWSPRVHGLADLASVGLRAPPSCLGRTYAMLDNDNVDSVCVKKLYIMRRLGGY